MDNAYTIFKKSAQNLLIFLIEKGEKLASYLLTWDQSTIKVTSTKIDLFKFSYIKAQQYQKL